MNDYREFANNELFDDGLLERLSSLRSGTPPGSMDQLSEEKLFQELLLRCRRKSRLTRFFRETAGDYWQVVLISILFCLLGLDLLRIIRFVLS